MPSWMDAPPPAEMLKKQKSWMDEPPPAEMLPKQDSLGSRAAKFATGAAVGAAEAMNPLNLASIPHVAETLGRAAALEESDPKLGFLGNIKNRIQKGSEHAFIPDPDLSINRVIAPGIRAAIETPFSEKSLSENFKSEQESQNRFNSGDLKTGNDLAQTAAGLYGLASLTKSAVKTAPKLAGFAESAIKTVGSKADEAMKSLQSITESSTLNAQDPSKLVKAKLLLDKIAGNLPDEVSKAIFARTEQVKQLMNNPEKASVFETAKEIRSHVDNTENLIGGAVGEYKEFLRHKNDIRLDNAPLVEMIEGFKQKNTLGSGETLSPSANASLDNVERLISNPTPATRTPRNYITVGDTVKIMDQLDAELQPYYNGTDRSPAMLNKLRLRQAMDGALEDKFPAFKETKILYKQFQDNATLIRSRIDNTNAESFLSNIYGANKTENRALLKSLVDQGQEAAASLQRLSKTVKSGDSATNMRFTAITDGIESAAEKVKVRSGQEFLDQIADKVAARRLKSFGDKDADELDRLIRDYAKYYETYGKTIGGAAGSILGAKTAGIAGAGMGSIIGGSFGGSVGNLYGTAKGKQIFNVDRVFALIQESKESPKSLRKIAQDAQFLANKFDKNIASKFIETIPMDQKSLEFLLKASAATNVINQNAINGGAR
jgi:hypothetical protein